MVITVQESCLIVMLLSGCVETPSRYQEAMATSQDRVEGPVSRSRHGERNVSSGTFNRAG